MLDIKVKFCNLCNQIKPIESFTHRVKGHDVPGNDCQPCRDRRGRRVQAMLAGSGKGSIPRGPYRGRRPTGGKGR